MHWFSKILPTCCTKRPETEEIKTQCVTLPEINLLYSESSVEDLAIKEKKNDTEDKDENLLNVQNQSRRSTNFTNFSFNLTGKKENPPEDRTERVQIMKNKQKTDELICGVCGDLAEGYCPACPFKRYCKVCFAREHGDKISIHGFVSYEKKRKMINLSSMKILFK